MTKPRYQQDAWPGRKCAGERGMSPARGSSISTTATLTTTTATTKRSSVPSPAHRPVSIKVPAQPISLRALFEAWRMARAGKVPSRNQLDFDVEWSARLLDLQRQINSGTWQPRASTCFIATRPKAREIHAPDFADRVVHHWLVPQLEAIWERRFIHDSYANRRGKGSHAAVRALQAFVRQVHSGRRGGWFLQLDIANFFNSIDRRVLWARMDQVLHRHSVGWQAHRVTRCLLTTQPLAAGVRNRVTDAELAQVPPHKRLVNAAEGCGLPIGNLSSQFFANVYLDALDQFAKHTLKASRYLRYVDDFVLVHHDRAQLEEWLARIWLFLADDLHVRLKDDIRLRSISDGIDFLGYVIRPTHTLVRRRVVAHARSAFAEWEQHHVADDVIHATPADLRDIQAITASYAGHFRHANSHRLQCAIERRFPWLTVATRPRRFHHAAEGRHISLDIQNG